MARVLAGLGALLVAGATHAFATVWFLVDTCAVSDTAERVPAPASLQGRLCDRTDHWLNALPYAALAASALLAAALAVLLWRRAGWRWVGLTACLWLPVLVGVGLALPEDTCTPAQRAALAAYACDTGPG